MGGQSSQSFRSSVAGLAALIVPAFAVVDGVVADQVDRLVFLDDSKLVVASLGGEAPRSITLPTADDLCGVVANDRAAYVVSCGDRPAVFRVAIADRLLHSTSWPSGFGSHLIAVDRDDTEVVTADPSIHGLLRFYDTRGDQRGNAFVSGTPERMMSVGNRFLVVSRTSEGAMILSTIENHRVITAREVTGIPDSVVTVPRVSPACAGDSNRDRQVTVDEIVSAVDDALYGCREDLQPDLVPVRAFDFCVTRSSCLTMEMEICTQNRGGGPSGPFRISANGDRSATWEIPGLAAFSEICVVAPYDEFVDPGSLAIIAVDSLQRVAESDETNNTLIIPAPERTKCDTCSPRLVGTPVPSETDE